jgi:GH25 family lysozyme M1 (1,4-beta-N-acetylmuramidase)
MTKSLWAPVATWSRRPHPAGTPYGVDLSNFQGTLTQATIDSLKDQNCSFVIVQAITGLDGRSYTRQQLQAAVDAGLEVQGYIWCFPGDTESSLTGRLSMFDGFAITQLWLDVEQAGVSVQDVNRALAICDAHIGKKTHIYTGKWFFDQQGWSGQALWSDRLLWDAHYDGNPDPDANFQPYGGWDRCEIKQYLSSPMDMNARRA